MRRFPNGFLWGVSTSAYHSQIAHANALMAPEEVPA